jgi:hypothetical protein
MEATQEIKANKDIYTHGISDGCDTFWKDKNGNRYGVHSFMLKLRCDNVPVFDISMNSKVIVKFLELIYSFDFKSVTIDEDILIEFWGLVNRYLKQCFVKHVETLMKAYLQDAPLKVWDDEYPEKSLIGIGNMYEDKFIIDCICKRLKNSQMSKAMLDKMNNQLSNSLLSIFFNIQDVPTDKVDAMDKFGNWYRAKIIEKCPVRGSLIHFIGWYDRHDEWISEKESQTRISKLGDKTN